ncbi:MAG: hypothetical protein V7676_07580 [Parasphingorhabdus sp.]|uniref:hypothetical protein n=1 Tax=Parasphingorhabdus sp. TaxID=2709688 RepID=UPI003001522F
MSDPTDVFAWLRLDDRTTTSGQPTEQQLADIKALGVTHVINLALHTHEKALPDEATSARDYATFMAYVMRGMDMSLQLQREMIKLVNIEEDGIPFCLGWQVIQGLEGSGYALQHTGADAGARSIAIIYPETSPYLETSIGCAAFTRP